MSLFHQAMLILALTQYRILEQTLNSNADQPESLMLRGNVDKN
jgi:hypothetical protein